MSPYKVVVKDNNEETVLSACISKCKDGHTITLRYQGNQKYSLLCTKGRGQTVGMYKVYKDEKGYSVVRSYPHDLQILSSGVTSLQSCQVVAIQDYCTLNEIELIKIMK